MMVAALFAVVGAVVAVIATGTNVVTLVVADLLAVD